MTKLIPISEVSELVGLKKTAIYLRISNGKFPGPIKLGLKCSRWNSSEIQAWLDKAIAERKAI